METPRRAARTVRFGVSTVFPGRLRAISTVPKPRPGSAVRLPAPATVKPAGGRMGHIGIGYELIAPEAAAPVVEIYVGDGGDRTGTVRRALDGTPQEIHPVD